MISLVLPKGKWDKKIKCAKINLVSTSHNLKVDKSRSFTVFCCCTGRSRTKLEAAPLLSPSSFPPFSSNLFHFPSSRLLLFFYPFPTLPFPLFPLPIPPFDFSSLSLLYIPAKGLRERCKLLQWGPSGTPTANAFRPY